MNVANFVEMHIIGGTHRSMLKPDSDVILTPRRGTLTSIPVRNLLFVTFFPSLLLTAFLWKSLIRLALFHKVIPVINHACRLKM
jgi:hypothetical protein